MQSAEEEFGRLAKEFCLAGKELNSARTFCCRATTFSCRAGKEFGLATKECKLL
ncbi:hypothetical protein [Candidatus Electronema sp. PJ]|uniref:hypothetical protein n=1 Tax=Candidatus Electronema sp. PJ TaxID=3401572 RepID=UPI003AA89BF1